MTKYLNAEDMLNNYEADCEVYENNGDSLDTESWMIDYLKNHSFADVQPVVHANWTHKSICRKDDVLECSNCGVWFVGDEDFLDFIERGNYCPHCGARMDGDEHD